MKTIPLTKGQNAVVDDDVYEWASKFKWYACWKRHTFYANRKEWKNGKYHLRQLHRDILGLTDPKIEGAHLDGNGLNNLRSNLKAATRRQNSINFIHRNA